MIKNIVIDCDGVLTDGKKYINSDGDREMIAFHCRDNEAVERLIEQGYRVIIVTASGFPGIRRRWMRCNVEVYHLSEKDTLNVIADPPFEWSETVGIGDDLIDLPFLEKCAHAFVPMDAHPKLKRQFDEIFRNGGEGVMEEIENRIEVLTAVKSVEYDSTY